MKVKNILKVCFYFLLICLSSCSNTKENILNVSLIQDGVETTLERPLSSVKLMKEPFEFVFYQKEHESEVEGKFNAIQMAALSNIELFKSIKVGQHLKDISFFSRGTGLAPYRDGYREIFITNEGHHYVFYADEENKRATLEKRLENGYLKLHFPVKRVFLENQSFSLKHTPVERLLFVIVIDRNLDGVINRDELTKLEVTF